MAAICNAAAVTVEKAMAVSALANSPAVLSTEATPACLVSKPARLGQSDFAGKSLTKLAVKNRGAKARAGVVVTRAVAAGAAGATGASKQAEREPYVRGWSNITKDIVIGGSPCTPDDVDKIIKGSGATALVCLQNDDSAAAIGMSWDAIKARAAQINAIAVRIPMKEFDPQDQAVALPEAVRAVASLISLGHKVYVNCTSGKYRSPLVALGYLTFVKTLDVTEAMEVLTKASPGASPYFSSWEEARSKLSAGDSRRVAQIASSVSEKRIREGKPGSPADDWLVAQRLLVKENIERGINTDILLTEAILAAKGKAVPASVAPTSAAPAPAASKDATAELERQNANLKEQIAFLTRQAEALKKREKVETKNVQVAKQDLQSVDEELDTLRKAEAKAQEDIAAARERLEFFNRQVTVLKEKEEAARKAANDAKAQIAKLTDQVKDLQYREKVAQDSYKKAVERAELLAKQLDELKNRESSAKDAAEVASERVKFLQAQPPTPAVVAATPIAKHAEEAAVGRLEELTKQVEELTKKEVQARQSLEAANERNDFFHRQITVLKEKEAAAKAQVKAAENKIATLQRQVDDLKFREAAARAAAEKGSTEVGDVGARIAQLQESEAKFKKAAEEAEARVASLSAQLAAIQQREASAVNLAKSANDRVAQLSRQANGAVSEAVVVNATIEAAEKIKELTEEIAILTKRAVTAEDNVKMGQDRIDFFFRQAIALKEREQSAKREAQEKISTFKRQVSELQRKVVQAERETAEAQSRIVVLEEKVVELETSEKSLKEQANVANDRIEFFFRQVASLREKEEAARKSTEAANSRIKQLLRQIEILEKKEAAAVAKAEQFAEQVSALLKQNSELHSSLTAVEGREAELVKALEEGSGMLTIALEADETIRRLKIEADRASAELEAAKQQAFRLQSEVERARQSAEISYKLDVPSSLPEGELKKELAGQPATIDLTPEGQSTVLRNVVVGALGLAALPVTAYTLMNNSPQPQMLAEVNFGPSATPEVEEVVIQPTIKSGQAAEFCSSVPPGLRSAQTEKFCSALSEIDNE